MKNRIGELDALRGVCILGMVLVHLAFDLSQLYSPEIRALPRWFSFLMDWGGVLFFLISGICVTLGRRCLRRGAAVFACGMLCTAVTWGMYRLGIAGHGAVIRFGVLHCLGSCMLLWHLFRHYPGWALLGFGGAFSGTGLYLMSLQPMDTPKWLVLLGLRYRGFASADWFPLLPFLGFFLIGAWLGRMLYARKRSLFPRLPWEKMPLRFLCACGRHSLWIYLLHQPVIFGLVMLLDTR